MSATSTSAPSQRGVPSSSKATLSTISIKYHTGDIFAAPDNTVIVHACNTKGSWGAGIALAFKNAYPEAYKVYHNHCISKVNPIQTGTCLLIAPCEAGPGPKHWIGCLFTSAEYGRKKDGPEEILKNTELAVKELLLRLKEAEERGVEIASLRMCKINSGKFGVKWERTEAVLEELELDEDRTVEVEIWDR